MATAEKDSLLSRVAAVREALDAAPSGDAVDRARYQTERLVAAIRSSHGEGIRFAAYTINHLLTTRSKEFPSSIAPVFAELKHALESSGHHF